MSEKLIKNKIVFFINPISGKKKKEHIVDLIKRYFARTNKDFEIIYTRFPGDAHQQVKDKYAQGVKRFVAVGGDGTVNEVASAIVNTDAILGIIPVGSGNGLARHLKIPLNPKKAIQLIVKGTTMQMDYGQINDKLFFCTTGVGFDAHIGHVFSTTKGRGFINYIKATITEFIRYKPTHYELKINNKVFYRDAFLITVANASQYGNNAYIAPKAIVTDGLMEVTVMKPFPVIAAPVMGARLFLKNIHKSKYVETFDCSELTIKQDNPSIIHFDGEPGEMDQELKIKIIPKGLNIFANG
ncbi:MAG: diacylglycerol kinase family lipid kinase [Bacteroidales bacterium]|jgi:YegS/Rv2252/BmrU family lipid kinase|nr:diacylglycerol kinase family lipid kinase [Bacteroidales bacterium]